MISFKLSLKRRFFSNICVSKRLSVCVCEKLLMERWWKNWLLWICERKDGRNLNFSLRLSVSYSCTELPWGPGEATGTLQLWGRQLGYVCNLGWGTGKRRLLCIHVPRREPLRLVFGKCMRKRIVFCPGPSCRYSGRGGGSYHIHLHEWKRKGNWFHFLN